MSRITRFNCSEQTLCNIAGSDFTKLDATKRNQARILNMYFSTPETYHTDVIDEIRSYADEIGLVISDANTLNGVSYHTITSVNQSAPTLVKPSIAEMTVKLCERLGLPESIVTNWGDVNIETAFVSLGLMPRQKTDARLVGYFLIDSNSEYPRFKASPASVDHVVTQYNEYVAHQRSKIAAPATVD